MPAQNQSPQNQSLQTEIISQGNLFLSPAEFFCGDKVTVSFTFSLKEYPNVHFENMFLSGSQINKIIQNENPDVSVTEISVSSFPSSLQGTIDLTCVFWKSGEVEIPVLKIPLTNSELNSELALGDGDGKTSASQLNDENEATMLEIHLPSVNVSSILARPL